MTVSGMQAAGLGLRLAGLGSDLGQNPEVECRAHLRFLLAWCPGPLLLQGAPILFWEAHPGGVGEGAVQQGALPLPGCLVGM